MEVEDALRRSSELEMSSGVSDISQGEKRKKKGQTPTLKIVNGGRGK